MSLWAPSEELLRVSVGLSVCVCVCVCHRSGFARGTVSLVRRFTQAEIPRKISFELHIGSQLCRVLPPTNQFVARPSRWLLGESNASSFELQRGSPHVRLLQPIDQAKLPVQHISSQGGTDAALCEDLPLLEFRLYPGPRCPHKVTRYPAERVPLTTNSCCESMRRHPRARQRGRLAQVLTDLIEACIPWPV